MSRAWIAAAALAAAAGLAACGGTSSPSPVGQVTRNPAPAVPTIAQVASALHATGATDCGRAPLGGVVDSGTAYLGSERIGIDTFAGSPARNAWLKVAASAGVVPLAQRTDWVSYKALSQWGKAYS